MSYVPSAYVQRIQGLYWILLNTPSGTTARLHMAYPSQGDAEIATSILGFVLVEPPKGELHRVKGEQS